MAENDKRILAVVVLFNPDAEEVLRNISKYYDEIDRLIVWDNTPSAVSFQDIQRGLISLERALYVTENENSGISVPLNYAVDYLQTHGYDYLLTMDQDSTWVNFAEYIRICMGIDDDTIGAFAPNINSAFKDREIYSEDHRTITSGMLVPAATYRKAGKYDERFFVDGVDVEFGRRIEKHHLKNVRINAAILNQKYGEAKIRMPWRYPAPEYSASRLYGIVSSQIWVMRHYRLPLNVIYEILVVYIIRYLFDILFYQDDKKNKTHSIFKGIMAGMKD